MLAWYKKVAPCDWQLEERTQREAQAFVLTDMPTDLYARLIDSLEARQSAVAISMTPCRCCCLKAVSARKKHRTVEHLSVGQPVKHQTVF